LEVCAPEVTVEVSNAHAFRIGVVGIQRETFAESMIQTGKQSMIIRKAVRPSHVQDSDAARVLRCAHPTCCKCQKASSCLISCILRACAAWRRCTGGRCNLWGVEVIRQRNVNAAVAQIRKRKRPVAEELALPAQVP